MNKVKECFEQYGAEYIPTMERFMGNEELYLRLLGKLFSDDNLRLLGDSLHVGDKESAFDAAHTLKGVAGNLGLTPLYQALCTIVEPLRAGEERDDYPLLYQNIQTEFHKAKEFWCALKEGE